MPPVRIGLVGYGKGGRFFHAPLIRGAAGCVLAGVVVRSPERRAAVTADLPGVPVHGDLGELAAAGVDAVVVSTPLDTHLPLVREAVERGCLWSATSPSRATRRRRGPPCWPPSARGSR